MQGTLELWINAFIPRDVPNYTQTVMGGMYGGQTAVPLPLIARPVNPFHAWDEGFLTDQRSFSPDRNASTRMQSSATITVSPHILTGRANKPRTSGTIGVGIKSGKVAGRASAKMRDPDMIVEAGAPGAKDILLSQPLPPNVKVLNVKCKAAGADPLVRMSAAIDYEGLFQVILDPAKKCLIVNFQGRIDDFPAFECYASFNGITKELWKEPPPKGNTVVDLLGWPKRPVWGLATFT